MRVGRGCSRSACRQRSARSSGQVDGRGRAVAAEVAHGQLAERLVAIEVPGCGPLIEQDDQLLTGGGGAETRVPVMAR